MLEIINKIANAVNDIKSVLSKNQSIYQHNKELKDYIKKMKTNLANIQVLNEFKKNEIEKNEIENNININAQYITVMFNSYIKFYAMIIDPMKKIKNIKI